MAPGPLTPPRPSAPNALELARLLDATPGADGLEGLKPFDFRAAPGSPLDGSNVTPIRPAIPDDLDRAFREFPAGEMDLFGADARPTGTREDDKGAAVDVRRPARWRTIAGTFALASVLLILSPFVTSYPYRRLAAAILEPSFETVAQAASNVRDAIPALTQSFQARWPSARQAYLSNVEWLTAWLEPTSAPSQASALSSSRSSRRHARRRPREPTRGRRTVGPARTRIGGFIVPRAPRRLAGPPRHAGSAVHPRPRDRQRHRLGHHSIGGARSSRIPAGQGGAGCHRTRQRRGDAEGACIVGRSRRDRDSAPPGRPLRGSRARSDQPGRHRRIAGQAVPLCPRPVLPTGRPMRRPCPPPASTFPVRPIPEQNWSKRWPRSARKRSIASASVPTRSFGNWRVCGTRSMP